MKALEKISMKLLLTGEEADFHVICSFEANKGQ